MTNIPPGIFDIFHTQDVVLTIDGQMRKRLKDHVRRSRRDLKRAGMEGLKMPEETNTMLNALLDRGLYESERDDGLWWSMRESRLYRLPRPKHARGSLWSRIRRGVRLLVREVRGL